MAFITQGMNCYEMFTKNNKYIAQITTCIKCKNSKPLPIYCHPCYTKVSYNIKTKRAILQCIFCLEMGFKTIPIYSDHLKFKCLKNPNSRINKTKDDIEIEELEKEFEQLIK